ncbi:hypothetical protein BCY91_02190 [Pelobium manganitolerans]|uniref:Polymerase beta nucleotidyltransferase domain-containing protein n=1 Tax=Pelobium manganitolerans TaxID=1842495 RepID=A0A419SCD1_9SPHI|nr:nucleotidyltransferase domain-containing protein [Pelobium manganitolerans]RKD20447.1 hypothetical protein BCY91_02190 [Pelobium manganitolerans]
MTDYLKIVKEIILKRVPLRDYSVFLFGSRARATNHDKSDIDVGVWGNAPLSKFLKSDLQDELDESIVPYKIDVIDFYKASDEFKAQALQKIEIWSLSKDSKLNSEASPKL